MLKFNIFGEVYDDIMPCFIESLDGSMYWNRAANQMLTKVSVDAYLADTGKSMGPKETGSLSPEYIKSNFGNFMSGLKGGPAGGSSAPAAITVAASKATSSTNDEVLTITVGGGPADVAYTVTVTVKDKASSGDDVQNVSVAKGDTAEQAATAIKTAISDPNVSATVSGKVVSIAPKAGSTVAKLTVAIAAT